MDRCTPSRAARSSIDSGPRASASTSRIRMPRLSVCEAGAVEGAGDTGLAVSSHGTLAASTRVVYDLFNSRTACSNIEHAEPPHKLPAAVFRRRALDTVVRGGHTDAVP